MSWSLRLRNGDLDVQNARLGVVNGSEKLVQDFRCALLTHMGHDPLHPEWGSLLDGGVTPDGRDYGGVIGAEPEVTRQMVETEIRRIAAALQARQLTRVKAERLRHNKVTLTASEILVGVSSVRMVQVADTLQVLVTLVTGNGTDVSIALPVNQLVAT